MKGMPAGDAVISPLLGDYPFPFLCGAAVAWKLALSLIGGKAENLMELAALATVADMVPLTEENYLTEGIALESKSIAGGEGDWWDLSDDYHYFYLSFNIV